MAANPPDVRDAVECHYKGNSAIEEQLSRSPSSLVALARESGNCSGSTVRLAKVLNLIIDEAVRSHASDIHIEPEQDRVRVRYRIDGTLQDMMSLPNTVHRAIISRIKILADMNIARASSP